VHELRSGGHETSYAALALRALRDAPELATPAVVDGGCYLLRNHVGSYQPVKPSRWAREHPAPPYADAKDLATRTFRATLRP
jgi:hypothetical protein